MKYYCKHCGKTLNRDSNDEWISSWCQSAGKKVKIKRISTMKIDVCAEQIESIIRDDLSKVLKNLEDDLNKRKLGKSIFIFHKNKNKDIKELKKHADALRLTLKYYSVDGKS